MLSKTTGSKSTALFCLLQISPEPAVESVFAFSWLVKIEHPYNTPTCLGYRRPSLGAKRTRLRYFEHVREKYWNISTLIRKQPTPKNKRKMEKLTPRRIHTAISSLRGQKLFTNSFTSDNNQLSRQPLALNRIVITEEKREQ